MLVLSDITFEIKKGTKKTTFFVDKEDKYLNVSVDVQFKKNTYEKEKVSPSLSIEFFETKAKSLNELIGVSFSVDDIDLCLDREDSFYIFEHEPFEKYTLTILDIAKNKAHIKCTGIAVIDGYANPHTTAPFALDCWLPIRFIGDKT